MKIKVFDSYAELSQYAAGRMIEIIKAKPDAVLGLATGSSPLGLYAAMIERKAELPDLTKLKTVNLDEYLGLPADHPQSYHYFMRANLFSGLGLRADQTYFPDAEQKDPDLARKAARSYEQTLRQIGQRSVQILGIGANGHIGFNEPAATMTAQTHLVDLAPSTIEANARFFDSPAEVPRQAITMGMAGIFNSQEIILIASGQQKREAIERTVLGPVTPELPASVLQLHPNVTLLLDSQAAGNILQQID